MNFRSYVVFSESGDAISTMSRKKSIFEKLDYPI